LAINRHYAQNPSFNAIDSFSAVILLDSTFRATLYAEMYDHSRIEQLVLALRSALSDPCVVGLSDHFAGYFDELGITVSVKPETSDEHVRMLKEKIAPVLFQHPQPFKWMVMFQRGGKQIAVLFPDGLFTLG
jgi:hypothetical protein